MLFLRGHEKIAVIGNNNKEEGAILAPPHWFPFSDLLLGRMFTFFLVLRLLDFLGPFFKTISLLKGKV